ncbi:gliding motility-associated C-terminal domain-containing protein [Niastella yeongjuensis]|nr:gliding motility-associated C-terminal domain-containing protein [Niastella yeongjuensis]
MKARTVACCVVIFLCSLTRTYSQSGCPPNLDFENGNFDNWECFIGNTDTIGGKNNMNLSPSAPLPDRHLLISAASNPGKDMYGGFPKICPYGGNYSVKLGNEYTGAQAEAISYTFQVPSTIDTFTFTYFYAVVLEDPQHGPAEQPRFFVTAYDVNTGAVINCASFDYVSTAGLPGFKPSPISTQVLYKSWTPTSLQFPGMGGHLVRLEFRTADCTRSGHFGYAYLDVASACSNILATAPYCIQTNSLILDAPFGFQNYTWFDANYNVVAHGQSATLSPPPVTQGYFYVDVEPYPGFGCRDTLQALVKPYPVPDLPLADTIVNLCQNEIPEPLAASVLPGHQLNWYTTPIGGIPVSTAPVPSTALPGVTKYYVSQKALYGCEGFRREIVVNVTATPVTAFNINKARQCHVGNSFTFTSISGNLVNPGYTWAFGDGKIDSSTGRTSSYSYPSSGIYQVKLIATNHGLIACSKTDSAKIFVVPKPTAAFNYPDPICEDQTILTITDQSSIPPQFTTINKWWWNINGKITTTQTTATFLAPPGGPFPVKLVVTTQEGCLSDTNSKVLDIHFRPLAEFKYGDLNLMCNNEIIRFTDLSTMPSAAVGETVSKWNWLYDNAVSNNAQTPGVVFSAGMHTAQLISENNYGCKSLPVSHSFEIFPKPTTRMEVSDSCVYVKLLYNAIDVSGTVVGWTWNWDDRSMRYGNSLERTFFHKGDHVLTLIGKTGKNCKDTIIRPVIIYSNESYAYAGVDTSAPYNEPIELDAHGEPGMQYTWSPLTGLNRDDVEKPIAILDHDQVYKLYTVTKEGCEKSTKVLVKRYAGPELYVPTAFTPNKDGKNDLFKVIPTGLRTFGFLAVYNRWGQLVYRTTDYHQGWDGTYNGEKVDAGSFIYVVQAVDYLGRPIKRKGTFVLLR